MVTALVLLLAACGGDDDTITLAGAVRTPPLQVGGVALPQLRSGGVHEVAPLRADPGELLLVYFGYTFCPDVCPTTMSDISVALADLPDDLAERVTVAMVTVDPERDTDEVLTNYLGHFVDGGIAVRSTDPAQLAAAGEAFGAQWEIAEHEPGEQYYDVAHSAITYVVDDTATVVVEWPFGMAIESMTSDLNTLLKET